MKAIDLFCGAGGASQGLHNAGFEVTGVDSIRQKHYPFEFIQYDVEKLDWENIGYWDFIWASPPCQAHSVMRKGRWQAREHKDWIPFTRHLLIASGRPYCIENVVGAPLNKTVMLCGSMFGLQTRHGAQLRRHRIFECSFPVEQPKCNHKKSGNVIGVYGSGQHPQRRRIPDTIGVYGHSGGSSKRDYLDFSCFTTQDRRDAMNIQWMTGSELSQAIPPNYSEYIAKQYLNSLKQG
jgi:DNA (cytosine-5)-methyltransferase 1